MTPQGRKAEVVAWMVTVPANRRHTTAPEVFLYYKDELPKAHEAYGDLVVPLIPAQSLSDMQARLDALTNAARDYRASVDQMNLAMQDGGNVHGAISGLIGATDALDDLLSRDSTTTEEPGEGG